MFRRAKTVVDAGPSEFGLVLIEGLIRIGGVEAGLNSELEVRDRVERCGMRVVSIITNRS